MENKYLTIKTKTEVLHKDRGSKFIGLAYPVTSESEIKSILTDLRTTYADATHVCYAYRLGINGETYRANDDGEPSNSAGQPILREIKSKELTNTLVAVVRYYGGKKLGVSGLIDAYGEAAKQAINETSIVERTVLQTCWIKHQGAKDFQVYELSNRLKFAIQKTPSNPGGYFEIQIDKSRYEELLIQLKSLPNFELVDELNRT